MFYIKVKSRLVDLKEDFRVDLVLENPLLDQERVPVPYTTSFEFPLTPTNKSIFDQPDRVNTQDRIWEYDVAEIGYGAHVWFYGILILAESGGILTANFQASDSLEDFKKPMNELDLGVYEFAEADYDGRKQTTGSDITALIQYQSFIASLHVENHPITAAPIKIPGEPESLSSGGAPLYNYMLWAQNNFFNAFRAVGGNQDGFTDPSDGLYKSGILPVFPQIRIAELIKRLLKLEDVNNPFIGSELFKMVLTSHFHLNWKDDIIVNWFGFLFDNDYPVPASPAEPLYFNAGSYQSQVTAGEVIKSVLNMLCMTIFSVYVNGKQEFRIKFNSDVINDTAFENWDSFLGSKLKLSRELGQEYSFGYADFNEKEPSIDSNYILNTVEDLLSVPVNAETDEQVFYVQTTGQFILKKKNDFNPAYPYGTYTYTVKSSGLQGSNNQSGFSVKADISPLNMTITENVLNWTKGEVKRYYPLYMPIYDGKIEPGFKPSIMLYQGLQPFENTQENTDGFPLLSHHNYNASGDRLGDLSLAWLGPDGLINNYHEQFKFWIEKEKLVAYAELIMSPYRIKSIDLSKKILLRSKLWWVKKLTIPLTKKKIEPIQAELIEAPLPGEGIIPDSSQGSTTPIPDPTGTCYTIVIDTTIFDPVTDYFNITIQRPGAAQSTAGYDSYASVTVGSTITIALCSEVAPILTQSGEVVVSVPGVSITAGGSCSIDGDCLL